MNDTKKSVAEIFTLFDDEGVKEKLKVMTKWEAICDDERNSNDFAEKVEEILEVGKKYKVTIQEL